MPIKREEPPDKQARYQEINRKFDAGTATRDEITEGVKLYAELYGKWWDDERTPEEIWPQLHQRSGEK